MRVAIVTPDSVVGVVNANDATNEATDATNEANDANDATNSANDQRGAVHEGAYVVIDVLRAFTTSAFAFASGVDEISLVASTDEAFELGQRLGDASIMGEESGLPIDGFDAGNSPSEFVEKTSSRRWIQRTSAGTRAAVAVAAAEHLLVASMVNARATVRHLKALAPPAITFVVSGARAGFDGGDDRACAEYLATLLRDEDVAVEPFLERIARSQAAAKFLDEAKPAFPRRDLELALETDRFDFAMVARREPDQRLVIRPVRQG